MKEYFRLIMQSIECWKTKCLKFGRKNVPSHKGLQHVQPLLCLGQSCDYMDLPCPALMMWMDKLKFLQFFSQLIGLVGQKSSPLCPSPAMIGYKKIAWEVQSLMWEHEDLLFIYQEGASNIHVMRNRRIKTPKGKRNRIIAINTTKKKHVEN